MQLREKLKYKRSPTTLQKTNCHFTSDLGFVSKKKSSRGPKHGASERQIMFFKAKEMLKKARRSKHGKYPTIPSQEKYRKSLAEHNIRQKEVMLFDRIALERHDFSAMRAERLQKAKKVNQRLNADGPQNPLRRTRTCRCIKNNALKMQDGHSETDTSRTSTTSTTRSAIRRRRKLRLLCRSENWMAVLQRATGKPAGSVFIFNFEVGNFTMANELQLMAARII